MKKLEEKLNKSINEETEFVNKIPLWKYIVLYVPLLFLMFATTSFIASLLFQDFKFDWIQILIQAIFFSVFFRIFHGGRKLWNDAWNNK